MKVISRRSFVAGAGGAGAAVLLGGCAGGGAVEVTAVEDLMREHGVIRRALLVYSDIAAKLRADAAPAIGAALRKTAQLFREFGEDYHEKKLEAAHIFPALKADPALAGLTDTLADQHARGREITDYILAVTR